VAGLDRKAGSGSGGRGCHWARIHRLVSILQPRRWFHWKHRQSIRRSPLQANHYRNHQGSFLELGAGRSMDSMAPLPEFKSGTLPARERKFVKVAICGCAVRQTKGLLPIGP